MHLCQSYFCCQLPIVTLRKRTEKCRNEQKEYFAITKIYTCLQYTFVQYVYIEWIRQSMLHFVFFCNFLLLCTFVLYFINLAAIQQAKYCDARQHAVTLCVCVRRVAYITYQLHAALFSTAKVMRCIQSVNTVACPTDVERLHLRIIDFHPFAFYATYSHDTARISHSSGLRWFTIVVLLQDT